MEHPIASLEYRKTEGERKNYQQLIAGSYKEKVADSASFNRLLRNKIKQLFDSNNLIDLTRRHFKDDIQKIIFSIFDDVKRYKEELKKLNIKKDTIDDTPIENLSNPELFTPLPQTIVERIFYRHNLKVKPLQQQLNHLSLEIKDVNGKPKFILDLSVNKQDGTSHIGLKSYGQKNQRERTLFTETNKELFQSQGVNIQKSEKFLQGIKINERQLPNVLRLLAKRCEAEFKKTTQTK